MMEGLASKGYHEKVLIINALYLNAHRTASSLWAKKGAWRQARPPHRVNEGRAEHQAARRDGWHTWMDRAWRISNTLDADFCVKALNETIYWFGPPGIMTAMTVPVHVIYLNRPAASVRHPHLDGRQGSLSGHHLH